MLWIEPGAGLIAAIVILVIVVSRRPANDLGAVSAQWMAAHRIDGP